MNKLEINVRNDRNDRKIVEVWLTNQEKQNKGIQEQMENLYQQCMEKKYFVAVYMSGNQDLVEETSALLRYNRKKSAEQEVRKKKACPCYL